MGYYTGKKVFLTGGSSGIGRSIALDLAKGGAHVLISARRKDKLDETLALMNAARVSDDQVLDTLSLDISDRDAVYAAAPEVLETLGGLDVLINNAGITHVGYIGDVGDDIYRQMIDVNYLGTVWVTKAFLPHFIEQKSGHIGMVSSLLGLMGLLGYGAYAASKHAITGFSDCLRQDLLSHGVSVTVLFPADTDTPQLAYENEMKPAETKALSAAANLLSPDDVARSFLAALQARRYQVIPGFESKGIIFANRVAPWVVRWYIDRELRKFAKAASAHA